MQLGTSIPCYCISTLVAVHSANQTAFFENLVPRGISPQVQLFVKGIFQLNIYLKQWLFQRREDAVAYLGVMSISFGITSG
jgi:uncharacterized membrane protein